MGPSGQCPFTCCSAYKIIAFGEAVTGGLHPNCSFQVLSDLVFIQVPGNIHLPPKEQALAWGASCASWPSSCSWVCPGSLILSRTVALHI